MTELNNGSEKDIQAEWNTKGEKYASEINAMVAYADKNGWENWKGEESVDEREHLADDVFNLLKKANIDNKTDEFRSQFPPSNLPFYKFLNQQSQSIQQLHFIDDQKIIFLTGTAYQTRQAYLLDGDSVSKLDSEIRAIGKSMQDNVFAVATKNKIRTIQGWNGKLIKEFRLNVTANFGITQITPFNDGLKLVLTSSDGIYLIYDHEEKLIHPINEDNDEDWTSQIDMENATVSHDNQFIVVGDQGYDHRVLDKNGTQIGVIGPQSSYPHFCLFSKNDEQLITNSCHFYNGVTIGVETKILNGLNIEAYQESKKFNSIDEEMRVYIGLSTSKYYILGDAYGYIKAIDKNGIKIWQHYLGSTISGITISNDEKMLWVGSSSGMLHKLQLDKGKRDTHVIGTANHYEEFRLLIWKDEPQIYKW